MRPFFPLSFLRILADWDWVYRMAGGLTISLIGFLSLLALRSYAIALVPPTADQLTKLKVQAWRQKMQSRIITQLGTVAYVMAITKKTSAALKGGEGLTGLLQVAGWVGLGTSTSPSSFLSSS